MSLRASLNGRRRAYTLIELVIVIALLGIAGALLVPHMVDQDNMLAQAAVRQLIGDLSFAQSDALANQEFRRVHFYDDGSGYCIVRVTADNYAAAWDAGTADYVEDPLAASTEGGRYIMTYSESNRYQGVTISDVDIDGGGSDLVYDFLGGTVRGGDLPGTGGTIEISSGDDQYEITVAPFTGKLTVREL